MWIPKDHEKKVGRKGLVGVAIDKDKGSKYALKWAIDNLLLRGQTVVLIHVLPKPPNTTSSSAYPLSSSAPLHDAHSRPSTLKEIDKQAKDLFLTFHCFCTRKDVQCIDVILEDKNIVKALVEYASHAAIENLVLGASRHGFIRRLKGSDIPSYVSKGAPEFCTVYVISKGKISSVRNASRSASFASPLNDKIAENNSRVSHSVSSARSKPSFRIRAPDRTPHRLQYITEDAESIKSPFARRRGNGSDKKLFGDIPESESDLSFVSSSGDRPSTDRLSVSLYNYNNNGRISTCSSSENSLGSHRFGAMYSETSSRSGFSPCGLGSGANSSSSQEQLQDEVEAEMRRLKLELKQTMDLYSNACREALSAKQKAVELHHWRMEEERRLEEARLAEEAAKAIAEREKAKCRAAIEAAEAAHRIAKLEAQHRISAEMNILREAHGSTDTLAVHRLVPNESMYRKYTIEEIETATEYFAESRKIGEGGYGPVYRCYLDHTPVAVKVLRPDAAQGREQFQREVEILSCMRHPNMVLLLGACPEYGCLVYEYMGNGSLDDRIFRHDNTPLSWQLRFRIAAEIGTGLLFLHQTKPEPLVHRDLKPANILLDHNYVSKISDVGLARLVPPSLDDGVTQFRMTSTAGTFCYIDPEYQQTGMLGVKSDIYSLGVVLLQLITAKPAMALAHHVGRSIEKGKEAFSHMLDQAVGDWPVEEALCLAKIAVQCAELRCKDRPDLGKEVMPELYRLKQVAQNQMNKHYTVDACESTIGNHSHVSITQDVMSDPLVESCEISSKSHSGSSTTD